MRPQEPSPLDAVSIKVALGPTLPSASVTVPPDGLSLQALERAVIAFALERHTGNRTRTARFLRLSRSALLYRIRKYRLNIPPARTDAPGVKE